MTSDFLHQENWLPRYYWNIVESGNEHLNTYPIIICCIPYLAKGQMRIICCLLSVINFSQLTPGKWYRFMFVFSSNNKINNYYIIWQHHINDNYICNNYYIFSHSNYDVHYYQRNQWKCWLLFQDKGVYKTRWRSFITDVEIKPWICKIHCSG